MLIKLTDAAGKMEIHIDAALICIVSRNAQNVLETVVHLKIATPQGPLVFIVTETPSEVAGLVNKALGIESGSVLIH